MINPFIIILKNLQDARSGKIMLSLLLISGIFFHTSEVESEIFMANPSENITESSHGSRSWNDGEIEARETTVSSNSQSDDAIKPIKDQIFGSVEEIENYYKNYAHHIGFSVRSLTATRNKNNEIQYKYIVCSKEGFKVEKKQSQLTNKDKDVCRKISNTRVGCKASASVKRTNDGKYVLFTFQEEHNHALCTPRKRYFLRSNRKVMDVQKNLLNTLGRVNIGPTQAFHIMKEQVGGYENVGFTCSNVKNYVRDLKALIADSDA